MTDLAEIGVRTYVSEPERGRRQWEGKAAERKAVYANRRRIRGRRGKRLLRKRGELVERPFAHELDTGGIRRVHLRGHQNILKRLLIHAGGFNLGLFMRTLVGIGKPRGLQGGAGVVLRLFCLIWTVLAGLGRLLGVLWRSWGALVGKTNQYRTLGSIHGCA